MIYSKSRHTLCCFYIEVRKTTQNTIENRSRNILWDYCMKGQVHDWLPFTMHERSLADKLRLMIITSYEGLIFRISVTIDNRYFCESHIVVRDRRRHNHHWGGRGDSYQSIVPLRVWQGRNRKWTKPMSPTGINLRGRFQFLLAKYSLSGSSNSQELFTWCDGPRECIHSDISWRDKR